MNYTYSDFSDAKSENTVSAAICLQIATMILEQDLIILLASLWFFVTNEGVYSYDLNKLYHHRY